MILWYINDGYRGFDYNLLTINTCYSHDEQKSIDGRPR